MAAHPITLDPDLQQRLERAAQREVRSPEFLLRDAVELYLNVHGETDRDAATIATHDATRDAYDGSTLSRQQFLAEADQSLEHYKRTGLHVTWEEVDRWLGKLQAGENPTLPECHN
jgi:predicted transcriptional regulator